MQKTVTDGKKNRWMLKVLGPYILALGAYELLLLVWAGSPGWLHELRVFMAPLVFGANPMLSHVKLLSGASGVWHIFLGSMFLAGRPLLKTYIVSEFVLCLPNFFYCLLVVISWWGYTGGPEYVIVVWVNVLVQCVVPLALAVGCFLQNRTTPPNNELSFTSR